MIKTVHFQTQDLSSRGLPLNAVNRNGGSKGINNTRDGGQGVSKMDIWKICIQNGYTGRYVSKMFLWSSGYDRMNEVWSHFFVLPSKEKI